MSTRYTKKDVRQMVSSLESIAKTVGVMPSDPQYKLEYHAGNLSNGIPARIECVCVQENGHRNAVSVRFIPEFTYKSTLREQSKTVEAAFNALYAVAMKD